MRRGNIPIKKIVLSTIATFGVISVAVLAPNALQVIKQFSSLKDRKTDPKYQINKTVKSLIKKKLIKIEKKNGVGFIKLTEKGEKELSKFEFEDIEIEKPKKWDGKWRVVIFDIAERKKEKRYVLRNTLARLGFVRLQNSVWVFPYDCEELITMLKTNLYLNTDVLYMKVESIENDKWLKENFALI